MSELDDYYAFLDGMSACKNGFIVEEDAHPHFVRGFNSEYRLEQIKTEQEIANVRVENIIRNRRI